MIEKLKSRKFLAALGGVFLAVGGALTGNLDWNQLMAAVVACIAAYQLGEGLADLGRGKAQ